MLCEGRIDAPGALYHIIAHGIEHRKLVAGDTDRKAVIERGGRAIREELPEISRLTQRSSGRTGRRRAA